MCPTEIIAFSERVGEFEKMNCAVVGASVDSVHSHLAWINTPRRNGGLGPMAIPLLGDISKKVATSFGVLASTKDDAGLALRATFLMDPKGVVRHLSVNDLGVGRNVDEMLRLVEAFQFVDENGEVCPAGWVKGAKTMKADPLGSKEYFEAANKE